MVRSRSEAAKGAGARPEGETHFRLDVVAAAFEGKSRVERHRLVNAALEPAFQRGLHALAVRARTPAEAAAAVAARPGAKFIAGGTNLLDLMKLQVETPEQIAAITLALERRGDALTAADPVPFKSMYRTDAPKSSRTMKTCPPYQPVHFETTSPTCQVEDTETRA